jgi:hypothetical protein
MLITDREFGIFKFVNIYFAREHETIPKPNYDVLTYHTYENWGDITGY